MDKFDLDGLLLRKATVDDVKHFDEVASVVHFDIGLHNWLIYYDISGPQEFWVIVDPKLSKIVGILTGNQVNKDLFWGHHVVILPEYRKKNRFQRAIGMFDHPAYFAGNRNSNSIGVFRHEPCSFGHKQIGFYGRLLNKTWVVKQFAGITVAKINNNACLVNQTLLYNLYNYDAELYKNIPAPNRHRWLMQWCFPEEPLHSSTVVAYDSKSFEVYGFGVGRLQTDAFYAVSPLYANSEEIAYSLLCEIANQLKDRECSLYMEFHANRRSCFQFAKEAGLIQTYANFRVYNPYVYDYPIEKLYCDNEFWPM